MSMAWRLFCRRPCATDRAWGPTGTSSATSRWSRTPPPRAGILDFLGVDRAASRQAFLAAVARADPRLRGLMAHHLRRGLDVTPAR
ncbi:MAG: hypothetical protein R3C32_06600 [Chloroflexota bacterium]